MKEKIINGIAYLFMFVFFTVLILGTIDNIITNLKNYKLELKEAILVDVYIVVYSTERSSNSSVAYVIEENGKFYSGSYTSLDRGNPEMMKIGDTIQYRKTQNIFARSIRAVTLNGEKVQSFYGPEDYSTLILLVLIPLFIYLRPRIIKFFKNERNKKINEIYNTN